MSTEARRPTLANPAVDRRDFRRGRLAVRARANVAAHCFAVIDLAKFRARPMAATLRQAVFPFGGYRFGAWIVHYE
jgi:hypothetical protein